MLRSNNITDIYNLHIDAEVGTGVVALGSTVVLKSGMSIEGKDGYGLCPVSFLLSSNKFGFTTSKI